MNIELTSQERRVLCAYQMDWRLDVPALVTITGLRSHSVSYALKRLREKKLLRPFVMYNIHALGLTDYCVFFNVLGATRRTRDTVLTYALDSSQTAYVAELSGRYQYSVSIMAHSIFEVESFFNGLGKRLERASLDLSFAIRAQWTIIPIKYLDPIGGSRTPLTRTAAGELTSVDDIDEKLLAALNKQPDLSNSRLAAAAGMPQSTVRYRLDQLERRGLILGYPNAVDGSKIGRSPFRILIVARGIDLAFRRELYKFAAAHPMCVMFVRCLGAWDFELNYDLAELSQGGEMVQELYDHFGQYIQSTTTVTELKVHKFHEWPLRSEVRSSGRSIAQPK